MTDSAPLVIGLLIITMSLRMAAVRRWRTVAVGVIGLLGGTYCERSKLLGDFHISKPWFPVASAEEAVPMEVDSLPMDIDIHAERDTISVTNNHTALLVKFGFPGLDNLRQRKSFILSYDRRNRVAHWVFEHLTRESVRYRDNVNRSLSEFFEDNSIHDYFRSRNSDYRRSGFDRGHLAAAGNHRSSQQYVDDTFVLSNISPQVGKGFNRDSWNRLEMYVRALTKKYANVYVFTGPLYLPRVEADGKKYVKYQVVGNNNVAVPTHFFKVIVGETNENELDLETYVLPNGVIDDNIPLDNFLVPKDTVERSAGLLLFDKIPRNKFRFINGKSRSG